MLRLRVRVGSFCGRVCVCASVCLYGCRCGTNPAAWGAVGAAPELKSPSGRPVACSRSLGVRVAGRSVAVVVSFVAGRLFAPPRSRSLSGVVFGGLRGRGPGRGARSQPFCLRSLFGVGGQTVAAGAPIQAPHLHRARAPHVDLRLDGLLLLRGLHWWAALCHAGVPMAA